MAGIKVGDTVRFDNTPTMQIDYLDGHEGTVVRHRGGKHDVEISWNEPLPVFPYGDDGRPGDGEPVTWTQYIAEGYLTVVNPVTPQYDAATAEAIAQVFRDKNLTATASLVERYFAELTQPKTHTVVVEFEVRGDFDITEAIESIYDAHDEILTADIKED